MIIDSSAIIAILMEEPGYEKLVIKIGDAREVGIGAPTLVECGIVLTDRLGREARGILARFLEEANITVIPFTEAHYGISIGAWLKYGKGRHTAGLNFVDCLCYAVARLADMPLLCVGSDFPRTDIKIA